jgi:single-strand DNA-binding protein
MGTPITVIGNVTRNPQLSRTHGGTPVVNLTLAENHRRQVNGEWVDDAVTYWEIVCFGAQAENIIGSLHRGVRAIAVGSPRTRTWTTAEGQDRSALEIVADEIGPSLRWAVTEVTRVTAAAS